MKEFKNKVTVIKCAASGIGREIAERCVRPVHKIGRSLWYDESVVTKSKFFDSRYVLSPHFYC